MVFMEPFPQGQAANENAVHTHAHILGLGIARGPHDILTICIAIGYCDCIANRCSKHIAHRMSAAEGQEREP